MPERLFPAVLLALLPLVAVARPPATDTLSLKLRSRVETFKGSGDWDEVSVRKEFAGKETALVNTDLVPVAGALERGQCSQGVRRQGNRPGDLRHVGQA